MSEERRRYVSYLLRLWQTDQKGALVWRASLESASDSGRCLASDGIGIGRPGERRGFATLDELCVFLKQETAALDEGKPRPPRCGDVDAQVQQSGTTHGQTKENRHDQV